MNLNTNFNFYQYKFLPAKKNYSFGSASDINLKYIRDNHFFYLPDRMKILVEERIKNGNDDISLRDLHLQTYSDLLSDECKTLDDARNMYPEFLEVLPYKSALKRGSANTRKIAEKISLDDLPLVLLQERWGKAKSLEEIAEYFGLPSRGSLAWIMEKIRIPEFGKNYQTLLNASDEERNNIIASKTRAYNDKHREEINAKNARIARDPKNRQLNKELADEMWSRMEHVRRDMSAFRAEHPDYTDGEFYQGFWDLYPEYKKLESEIRLEIGAERRARRKSQGKIKKY